MIHEYLFLTDEYRSKVEKYKPDNITVNISNLDNTQHLWVITFIHQGKNEESAKLLSDIHDDIMKYSPLVLSCESSEYYNRILFPLINGLERKLRKLLYLAASISGNGEAGKNIKELEKKDFGEIFDLLFIDQKFICDMKIRINADGKSEFSGMNKYSKSEIQSYLNSLSECPLWDEIIDDKQVQTLRKRFRDVQSYRNDVMHAHNINNMLFSKAHYLFKTINRELDCAIDNLIGNAKNETVEFKPAKPAVNTAISSALAAMNLSILEASKSAMGSTAPLAQLLKQVIQPVPINMALAEVLKNIQIPTIQPAFVEAIQKASALQSNPEIETMRKQMKQIDDLMRAYRKMLQPYRAVQDSINNHISQARCSINEENEDNGDGINNEKQAEENSYE